MDLVRAAFDFDHYLAANPDVLAAGLDPFEHFMERGWREGRDPTPTFSVRAYLAANPDIEAAGLNPFDHYIRHGRAEGRLLVPVASALDPLREHFDEAYYLKANPEVAAGGMDAFDHFMAEGWRAERDPNHWFSIAKYLKVHADVVASGINPFVHYIHYGRAEGRALDHGLDFRYGLLARSAPFEERIQSHRDARPDGEPTPIGTLTQAMRAAGDSADLYVTVSHDDYTAILGGIQLCLRLEAEAMAAAGMTHVHLFPAASGPVIEIGRKRPLIGVLIDGVLAGTFEPKALKTALGGWVQGPGRGRATTFAVHSLLGHVVDDVIAVLGAIGARAGYYWVHDYSSLCAGFTLMRNDVVFCGAPPPDSAACRICAYGERRRINLADHVRFFEAFEVTVLAPSAAALTLWQANFPLRPRAARVHRHARLEPKPSPPRRRVDRPLQVAFLGMPATHKGWPVYAALVARFGTDPRFEFHHLAGAPGSSEDTRFTAVEPTAADPEPMIAAVEALEIDIAIIWSLWPETFCFTAHEAVAGGAIVLTNPDAGNVVDFVRSSGHGRIVADDTALFELFSSPEIETFARARRKVSPYALRYSRMTADFVLEAA